MNVLRFLFPGLREELRSTVRTEVRKHADQTLLSHAAARQALDVYEMKLETLDTRMARRLIKLEARIAELEMREQATTTRRVA